ncbi:hypothetical protein WME75_40180 [Sorangium sp. So ce1014]|uniref:hypothetical protein n=1 Tax=Sorangium sp. So ce1014 TaxID=3133326 RepID=UPI003F624CB5
MTRAYPLVLLPLTLALLPHVLGCSGGDTDASSDGATSTSSSSGNGSGATGGSTTGATGGSTTATTGGGATTGGSTTTATTGGGTTTATTGGGTTEKFSFFVTSLVAMREQSGSQDGFGGDLRFGETGPGAGLRGADKICATIAEKSLPGAGGKTWRAFLSAAAGEDGKQVDAIDRIGEGPWYDRLGRLIASNKQDLLGERPAGAEGLGDDLPNEDGVPNHQPDPSQPEVDNHDTMTGSDEEGRLFGSTATCSDWTSAAADRNSKPRLGHSWPRNFGGGGPGGPGGGFNMAHWMSAHDAAGCTPGVNLVDAGGPGQGATSVGSGGGYGGIYCFALTP